MPIKLTSRRMLLVLCGVLTVLSIVLIAGSSRFFRSERLADLAIQADAVARRVAASTSPEIWDVYSRATDRVYDEIVAGAILDGELSSDFVRGVLVFGDYGRLVIGRIHGEGEPITLRRNGDIPVELSELRSVRTPITRDSVEIGFVEVYYTDAQARQVLRQVMTQISILVMGFTTFIIIGLTLLYRADRTLVRLMDTQDKLVEARKLAALGTMVAGVAHEVNTPLGIAYTAISYIRDVVVGNGSADFERREIHLDGATTEAVQQSVVLTMKSLERVTNLMMTFKQVSSDSLVDDVRPVDLKSYVEATLDALSSELRHRNITYAVDAEDLPKINTYPGAIFHIITNLVNNSLIHGFTGLPSGRISINLSPDAQNKTVVMTYRDDGVGMDETVQRRIFEPFFTTQRASGGTGLGMHILFNLVTSKMHGDLDLQSEPGEGIELRIRIPDLGGHGGAPGRYDA